MHNSKSCWILSFLLLFASCTNEWGDEAIIELIPQDSTHLNIDAGIKRNGKLKGIPKFTNTFEAVSLDSLELPVINANLVEGLRNQLRLLKSLRQKKVHKIDNLTIRIKELESVIEMLIEWQLTAPIGLSKHLTAHQLKGEDNRGNVRFTGYFTPILNVEKKPKGEFIYPLYKRPKKWKGRLPSRALIDGKEKVLKGKGLEIAYCDNLVSIYYMQVQGSGFVSYPDGSTQYLAYSGTNRHPYRSIGRYIVSKDLMKTGRLTMNGINRFLTANPQLREEVLFHNPSYTFFTPKGNQPKGSGGVPLTEDYSIAVDRSIIPLGACLLAAIPISEGGRIVSHEYRFLLAQDVGGAIKGSGHVDLYTGIGAQASKKATEIHHYGQLYLLLPKV